MKQRIAAGGHEGEEALREINPNPMTRRDFLARTGATFAGVALGGALRADPTSSPKIVLGTGAHKYECLHDWLMPPSDVLWGYTQGVTEDANGNLYVTHTVHPDSPKKHAIVVFDKHGKFVTSWGERFNGGGHGLDIRKEGSEEFLYHCDTANRLVVKTTLDGNVIWEKGVPLEADVYGKEGKEHPFVPTNVAFGPNGDFYVADGYGSSWVHQYNGKGDYVRTFGGPGTEPGKMRTPHGVWLDDRGKEPMLIIADRENNRLQQFTLDGKYVRVISEGMRRPCHFSIHHDLMVIPDLNSVVTLVDKEDKVVTMLGDGAPSNLDSHPRSDFIPGKFIHPHAARFLKNGNIVVAEWLPIGRITLLKKVRG